MSSLDCAVVGVGMTPFMKYPDETLKTLGVRAIDAALSDAGLDRRQVQMAFVANAMGAVTTGQVSVTGQVILNSAGISGIPVFNIDNACASSSSALYLACQAIRSGDVDVVLVAGVEKLYHPDRTVIYKALNGAADIDWLRQQPVDSTSQSVFLHAVYPERMARYQKLYPVAAETVAKVAVKNHRHAVTNPNAQYRKPFTLEQVLAAPALIAPLTTLMCAPIGDGAAAAIVCSRRFAERLGRKHVWVLGCAVSMGFNPAPDEPGSVERVAHRAYTQAGVAPEDVSVAEVHDTTAFNELLLYEELGFCGKGAAARLVEDGVTTLGGRLPVNPSGGLESRGHPVAATGLAQIAELVWQLRAEAGDRQVDKAVIGLAQNSGGFTGTDTAAIAVTILGR